MTGDGLADLLAVGLGQHERVARLPLLECHRPRAHVEERVHAHQRAARLELGAGVRAQQVDPVGEDDALGTAGAAAREEHDMGVGLGEAFDADRARILRGCEVGQAVTGARSGRAAGQTGDPCRWNPQTGGELGARLGAVVVGRLVESEIGVGGTEGGARLGDRGERGHRVETGCAPRRHPVTGPDAEAQQGTRRLVRARLQLGVAQRRIAVHRCGAVWHGTCRVGEDVADEQVHAATFHEGSRA